MAARLLTDIELDHVLIEESPVEEIIRQVFADGRTTEGIGALA